MTERRYFTAREIDALIPQLEHIFDHIETCHTRAEELAAQALRAVNPEDSVQVASAQLLRSQVEFLMEAIQEDIRHIETLGGVTKDVELGLVDFLGDVEGQDVWICWRRGEPKVGFWHALDAGYNQRRALARTTPNTIH
jgi:hypothetical protein